MIFKILSALFLQHWNIAWAFKSKKYSFLEDKLWYQADQFQVSPYNEGLQRWWEELGDYTAPK